MRKILSFVLVLSLVLGSFSMAFAADAVAKTVMSDVKGTSYEEAVTVLVDLGVVTGYEDGTYKPEATVTRAEAAIIVIKALGMANSVGNTKSAFADMSGYGWAEPYIAFANKLGILTGYPDGTFKPGQTVSYNEFATMMVRALGYSDESLPGNWPANYVNKAAALSIMDNIKSAGAAGANRGDVAVMVKNNLGNYIGTVDKDNIWNATIKSGKGTEKDPYVYDSIVSRLGGKFAEGVMDADMKSLINLMPYVGKYVEYYYNDDDEVIAVAKVVSETLRGEFNHDGKATAKQLNAGTNIEFEADDSVDYKLSGADMDDYTEFVNGEIKNVGDMDKDTTFTINVKLSGKKITDWYSTIKWEASDGDQVDEDQIADIKDGELLGYDFETTRNGEIMANSYELIGVSSLSDIAKDNVVYVYANKDKEIRRVAVGTEVVKGTISDSDKDDGWKVDGKWYKNTSDGVGENAHKGFDYDAEVGNDVELILDAYGDIYDYEMISGAAKNYAVVTGTSGGMGQVKLSAQDGSNKVYDTDLNTDDQKLLDTVINQYSGTGTSAERSLDIDTKKPTGVKTLAATVVGYDLNKHGEVDAIYAAGNLADGATTSVYMVSNKIIEVGGKSYTVDSNVVVFAAKTKTSIDKVVTAQDIKKDKQLNATGLVAPQVILKDGKVVAIVVDKSLTGAGSDDAYAVFSKKTSANNDGTKAYRMTGVSIEKNKSRTLNAVLTSDQISSLTKADVDKVELYEVDYDSAGDITDATFVATNNGKNVSGNASATSKKSDGYVEIANKKEAVSQNAVWLQATMKNGKLDEYKAFSKEITKGSKVYLYETNDDKGNEGFDIVIVEVIETGGSTSTGSSSDATYDTAAPSNVTVLTGVTLGQVRKVTVDGVNVGADTDYAPIGGTVSSSAKIQVSNNELVFTPAFFSPAPAAGKVYKVVVETDTTKVERTIKVK